MLRRVGFVVGILFCSLLGACGTPPKTVTLPEPESLTGLWRDTSFVLESCGVQGGFGLELDLVQTGQRVSGFAKMDDWTTEATELLPFAGMVQDGKLVGVVTHPNFKTYGVVTFDFTLTYDKGLLTGSMLSQTFTCKDGKESVAESNLKLITTDASPVAPDALEPNNTSDQATPINLGFNREMLVSGSNDDWFSFTLTETTQLNISHEPLSQAYYSMYLTRATSSEPQVLDFRSEPILPPGTHYIQVTSYETIKYRLNVVKK